MHKKVGMFLLVLVGVLIVGFIAVNIKNENGRMAEAQQVGGNTLYVGGSGANNYTSIQDAINDANDGDTIFVYSGVYYENVVINKRISLIGEDKDTTIIDGLGTGDVVKICNNSVSIENFRIVHGRASYSGIKINNVHNVTISNCNISSNNGYGIYICSSLYNVIHDCKISNNEVGVALINSSNNNSIFHSSVSNNKAGIAIYSSNNNTICSCDVYSNNAIWVYGYGVGIIYSSNNSIFNCSVSYNDYGIGLESATNNIIYNCDIRSNDVGIYVSSSLNNQIYGCNIYNHEDGIQLQNSANNTIYLNNFVNNDEHIEPEESNNIWHSLTPIMYTFNGITYTKYLGNYWDDYTGGDVNGDGIGDDPYNIDGEYDYCPLIAPYRDQVIENARVHNLNKNSWYYRIRAAIIDAGEGDIIFVCSGIYYENIEIYKRINLVGEDKDITIISGSVKIAENEVKLQGFTIKNSESTGIYLFSSNNNIFNCNISNNEGFGIFVGGSYNTIYDCNIYSNDAGIEISDSYNTIYNCNIYSNSGDGIYLYGSSNNIIYNCNIFANADCGIQLDYYYDGNNWYSSHNTIYNCNIYSNNNDGIYAYLATDNIIYNCNIHSNNDKGIAFAFSYENIIYSNNFIGNGNNAYSGGSRNTWYSIEPIKYTYNGDVYINYLGNYWDDYSGFDNDGDGIGDSAYLIDIHIYPEQCDRYPLIQSWENYVSGIGKIHNINKDTWYNSIQDAIDDAMPGDTIFVCNGTYYENIVINKRINLMGEDKETTIIDGMNAGDAIEIVKNSIKISNLTIRNSEYGISVNSSFNSIIDCIIYNNEVGIAIEEAENNTISRCKIFSNNYSGIGLGYVNHSAILNCNISNNYIGICLDTSSNNTILNCNLVNDGIAIDGYILSHFIHNIYSNTVNGKPLLYYKNENNVVLDGIEAGEIILVNCSNFEIKNMNVNNTDVGAEIIFCDNINISSCYFTDNLVGCAIAASNNCTIYDCKIEGVSQELESCGILFGLVNNSKISCCEISCNYVGIVIDDSHNNTIILNQIHENKYGIEYRDDSSHHYIHYNNIYNNDEYGIYNEDAEILNATYNWWGSPDGPGGIGPGSGDNVSDNVIYEPWLTEPISINIPPSCSLSVFPLSGYAPLTVTFTMNANDEDGYISSWSLDIDNDGIAEYSGVGNPPSTKQYTYQNIGTYTAKLTVTDNSGMISYDAVVITVNEMPPQEIDLTVTSVDAPVLAYPGDYITVSWTVENRGNTASSSFYNRVSLATTPYGTDISLGNFEMDSIPAGSPLSDSRNVQIPIDITPGYYYVTVYADAYNEIDETNEDNNINHAANQIYIATETQHAPSKPTISGDSSGYTASPLKFYTSSIDVDGDKIKYGFDWNNDGVVDGWTGYYDSGATASISHVWNTPGSYYIKVIAEDENGLESDWSNVKKVTINLPPSTKPVIYSLNPSSGAPGIEMTINGANFNEILIQKVMFGYVSAEVVSWSDNKLIVIVPPGKGIVDVTAGIDNPSNSVKFTYKEPHIDSLEPAHGEPGDQIEIRGNDFGLIRGIVHPHNYVKFGKSKAKIVSWEDNKIVVKVPSDYGTGIKDANFFISLFSHVFKGNFGLIINVLKGLFVPGVALAPSQDGILEDVVVTTPVGSSNTVQFAYKFPTSMVGARIKSPCELRIYDSEGRVTGMINGTIKEEIPASLYDKENKTVIIFFPNDTYYYKVVGSDKGEYGLEVIYIENGSITNFTAMNISISKNATHRYDINWSKLSQGKKGVSIKIDNNGDGKFEKTGESDNKLTKEEYHHIIEKKKTPGFEFIALITAIAMALAYYKKRR